MTICNKVENRKAVVEHFYLQEDVLWHQEVHKNKGSIQENIESTLKTISEYSEMYEVDENGELAAFFVRAEKENIVVLEGFHVGKEFRNKEFFSTFWKLVKSKLGGCFYTGIYEQNKSALEHLLKQGFKIVNTTNDEEQKVFILKLN